MILQSRAVGGLAFFTAQLRWTLPLSIPTAHRNGTLTYLYPMYLTLTYSPLAPRSTGSKRRPVTIPL